jgi:hypothetical protein
MDKPKIFIHNIETGEEKLRDMTPEEIAELPKPNDKAALTVG